MSPAKLARYEKGYSVEQAAAESQVHERTIRRIENGEVQPSAETAKALATAYGVSVATLLGVAPLAKDEAA